MNLQSYEDLGKINQNFYTFLKKMKMTLFFCKECTAKYLFVKHENNFQKNIINQYPELKGVCVAHAIVKIGENMNFSDVIINTGKMENYICQST